MEPAEFKQRWKLTNSELAALLGLTEAGIQNWFRSSRTAPVPESVRRTLAEIHLRFLNWENETTHLPAIEREIFEQAIGRERTHD